MNDERRYINDHVGELGSGDAENGYDNVELMMRDSFVENDHVQRCRTLMSRESKATTTSR